MSVFPIGRPFETDPERVRGLWWFSHFGKWPVLYVCDRECRTDWNRGLFFAAELANDRNVPLVVAAVCDTSWSYGNFRHLSFDVQAIAEMSEKLSKLGIPVFPFLGDEALSEFAGFVSGGGFSAAVFDFFPLKRPSDFRKSAVSALGVSAYEVDSRCAVPVWAVSDKREVGARTLRPKFWKRFVPPPVFRVLPGISVPYAWITPESVASAFGRVVSDRSVLPVPSAVTGESHSKKALLDFVSGRLSRYADLRNDPNSGASSGLSAQFRNGSLSWEETYLAVTAADASEENKNAFLEEFFIRRELSENFCLHSPEAYDGLSSAPMWALESLAAHSSDPRTHSYSPGEFERGETHDDLWNACQNELVTTGKMASYLRMYWAKKILEWSGSPTEAHRTALMLNDRYALDGRSPNGYAGVLWSIAGLHDRPWFDRETYGVVRYMNRSGCERKFDVSEYVRRFGK